MIRAYVFFVLLSIISWLLIYTLSGRNRRRVIVGVGRALFIITFVIGIIIALMTI